MADSLLAGLAQQFTGNTINQLASVVGAGEQETGRAVAAALPMLLGSISGAAEQPEQRNALFGALDNDHDGSILDSLGSLLGGGYATRVLGADGSRILDHVLGSRQGAVEQTVARSSGLQSDLIKKLLPILAPIVMGYIGKKLRGDGLDAGGLGSVLGGEQSRMREDDSGLGGILDALTGGDDNGLMDMAGDLLGSKAGRSILGQILGG